MLLQVRRVSRVWVLFHLLYLSVEDLRDHQISMIVVLELLGSGLLYGLAAGHFPQLFPGCMMLLAGYASREQIGYGDGWLMLALGMWLELTELLWMLFIGMGLGGLSALLLHKKELPLVPFLTAAYMIGVMP